MNPVFWNVWALSCGCYGAPIVRQRLVAAVQADSREEAMVLALGRVSPGVKFEVEVRHNEQKTSPTKTPEDATEAAKLLTVP